MVEAVGARQPRLIDRQRPSLVTLEIMVPISSSCVLQWQRQTNLHIALSITSNMPYTDHIWWLDFRGNVWKYLKHFAADRKIKCSDAYTISFLKWIQLLLLLWVLLLLLVVVLCFFWFDFFLNKCINLSRLYEQKVWFCLTRRWCDLTFRH